MPVRSVAVDVTVNRRRNDHWSTVALATICWPALTVVVIELGHTGMCHCRKELMRSHHIPEHLSLGERGGELTSNLASLALGLNRIDPVQTKGQARQVTCQLPTPLTEAQMFRDVVAAHQLLATMTHPGMPQLDNNHGQGWPADGSQGHGAPMVIPSTVYGHIHGDGADWHAPKQFVGGPWGR